MPDDVHALLTEGEVVDITTTGRKTGEARRIEIRLHVLNGQWFLTGRPGTPRSWYANIAANPDVTVHLKKSLERDVPTTASVVRDEADRRRVFALMLEREERMAHVDVDAWTEAAALIELTPA